jgi:hypothetical protein
VNVSEFRGGNIRHLPQRCPSADLPTRCENSGQGNVTFYLAPNVTAGEVIDEVLIIAELFVAQRRRKVSTVLVRYRSYDGTEEGSCR